jgi:hypothetical protein
MERSLTARKAGVVVRVHATDWRCDDGPDAGIPILGVAADNVKNLSRIVNQAVADLASRCGRVKRELFV